MTALFWSCSVTALLIVVLILVLMVWVVRASRREERNVQRVRMHWPLLSVVIEDHTEDPDPLLAAIDAERDSILDARIAATKERVA